MSIIWLSAALLCLLTLWALWRPLRSQSTFKMESIQQRNIAIARERAAEIESAYESGDIEREERDRAKQDLEITLADELASSAELKSQFRTTSKISSFAILAIIPLLAVGLYSYTSNYQADATTEMNAQTGEIPSLEEIFKQLEEKVKENPSDQQGLFLLAQSYARVGRYQESAERYQQLIKIAAPSADLYASLADSQAMAAGGAFNENIADALSKALELDPEHVSALWLSGMANQQLGQPETALSQWLKLEPLIINNAEARSELAILIKDVSEELGEKADEIKQQSAKLVATPTSNEVPKASLTLKVSLSPALKAEAKQNDTVFIFAKAKSGPPMPLAAARLPVADLPVTVTLDDSMAMLPQMKLSSFDEVLVGARITRSGQAIAQSGDLESELIATQNNNEELIELIISKRKP